MRAAEQLDCVPALRRVGKILRHQLERYDGGGAPDGLRGDRVPLGARVLAIASAFDLLTTCSSERVVGHEEALQQMLAERGEIFDPWLVDMFAEDVRKDPPSASDEGEVMIVPGGALPWRMADDDRDEEDGVDDGELEVMLDEPKREDPA